MTGCPRRDCGGIVGATWSGNCTLCARSLTGTRPPTAEELHSRTRGGDQETDYFRGIYQVGYKPTHEELSRAVW